MNNAFYLQDTRSNTGTRAMFWSKRGGYTSSLGDAEEFTWEKAVSQYQSRETDLPWPKPYVDARAQTGVDFQYLNAQAAAAEITPESIFFVAYPRQWDGNDLVWRDDLGKPTANLDGAIRPNGSEAAAYYQKLGFELWPAEYILEKSRKVVVASDLDIKQAMREAGVKLPKIKRQRIRKERFNCEGCGRFIDERQRYSGCDNCGESCSP
ncbi:MAG: hypothetical protein WA929_15175 [Pseudomonas neustonica]|jgi:hypothetical protein